MTGESIATRYGSESRPSRTHQHLLHPSKTDEIEVLESGALNHHPIRSGISNHPSTKVSFNYYYNSNSNNNNKKHGIELSPHISHRFCYLFLLKNKHTKDIFCLLLLQWYDYREYSSQSVLKKKCCILYFLSSFFFGLNKRVPKV